MKSISATILVKPHPWQRPGMRVVAGHATGFTPKKTVNAEALIIASIRNELREPVMAGGFEAGVPLSLSATFFLARPKGAPKRVVLPTKRPDLDNYAKTLLDALQSYVFPDDAQLTTIKIRKRFGEPPRIELTIAEEEVEALQA